MDYKTFLSQRRAIRDFFDKEVPLSVIQEILQESCMAPTASNRQPCRFIIIRNRNLMKQLSDDSKANLLADALKSPGYLSPEYEARLRDETFNVFYTAPCLIYFIGPKNVGSLDVDTGLTVAYFMFGATDRGLGTCWVGLGSYIRNEQLLKEIGMPADCRIVAPVIVGYPSTIPPATERRPPNIVKIIN